MYYKMKKIKLIKEDKKERNPTNNHVVVAFD